MGPSVPLRRLCAFPGARPRAASARAACAGVLVLAATALAGCGKPGPGTIVDLNGDPSMGELADELRSSSIDTTDGTWESAPWTGTPWLAYSPRTQVHISHPLGRRPRAVLVYLSFVEEGTSPALAAGDLARLVEVTDSEVTIWNDTNGSYFARVVLF